MAFPKTKPIPETHHDILVDRPTGHLATLRPDGRLSVNPVALMWDGEHVRVSTLKSRKKYRNLRHDPRVAISIPHRNNPNRYVEIRGIAELTDDGDRSFVNSVARHYMDVDEYPFDGPGDERVTITIHAEQVSAPDIPLADEPPTAPDPEFGDGGE
jgi:PPOX class probable F420-dependent enzyme